MPMLARRQSACRTTVQVRGTIGEYRGLTRREIRARAAPQQRREAASAHNKAASTAGLRHLLLCIAEAFRLASCRTYSPSRRLL